MSKKHCPKAPIGRYKPGSSFCGPIISICSPEKGLFYVLKNDLFDKFQEFESYVPTQPYADPPPYGDHFLFVNRHRKCYRAFRLNSNPACPQLMRAYLFDVGSVIYRTFTEGSCFKMPAKFLENSPMAIFCYIESTPSFASEHQTKSEFLTQSQYNNFTYVVQRKMEMENIYGKSQNALVVEIREFSELTEEGKDQEENDKVSEEKKLENVTLKVQAVGGYSSSWVKPTVKEKTFPPLTYLENGINCGEICKKRELPAPGSKLMIFLKQLVSLNSLYACFMAAEDFTSELKLSSEARLLYIWMNSQSAMKSYRKRETKPAIGEMVLARANDGNIHRGKVLDNANEFFPVFFIDLGYKAQINFRDLHHFPREFASLPAQVGHFSIENVSQRDDIIKAKRLMEEFFESNAIADVISASYEGSQMSLSVKLYSDQGEDIDDYLDTRMNEADSLDRTLRSDN